jgi:hypothetical protein
MAKSNGKVEMLERGDVYFFYRPKIQEENPESVSDIQRFYMVLSPEDKQRFRMTIIGQKQLPDPSQKGRERYWGFVDMVRKSPESIHSELEEQTYKTKTRGERHTPAARPAGEGVYRIIRHDGHTHLAYALELPKPKKEGEVQEALDIERDASYIISVKNPERGSPLYAGLSEERQAHYPQNLREQFRGRKFADVDPPEFLNHEGTEFVLVAAAEDVKEELGFEMQTDDENASKAGIFNDLRADREAHPTKPLFEGEWD